jgi:hypothetical protein
MFIKSIQKASKWISMLEMPPEAVYEFNGHIQTQRFHYLVIYMKSTPRDLSVY